MKALRQMAAWLLVTGGSLVADQAFAGEVLGLECSIKPDGSVRLVIDVDDRERMRMSERGPGTVHRVRLLRTMVDRPTWGRECAADVRVSIAKDSRGGSRVLLQSDSSRALTVYSLAARRSLAGRIVFDLSAPIGADVTPPAAVAAESPVPPPASAPTEPPPAVAPAAPATTPESPSPASSADVAGATPDEPFVDDHESPWQLRGYVGAEARLFSQTAQYDGQSDSGVSAVIEPEVYRAWGDDSLVFRPYLRWDQHDDDRSYFDIRELLWLRAGDGWEVAAGVGKVFWGVTEAYHLVDVINQTDLIANPDGEQKLGQPMLRGSLERDWGTLTLFALPGFRERTYPGEEGRFRPPLVVDTDNAQYRDGRSRWSWDWALRWSHYFGDLDIGLAHFHGTGRDPTLTPGLDSRGQPVLIPVYELVDQTSLDLQLTRGDWLWKLEAMRRSGQGETFWATTGGFEYTLVGVAGTDGDLGLLAEYMYDSRGNDASTPFNHDVFLGMRWTANDVAGSTLLAGMIRDWDNGATAFNLEASRRFGQRWKLQIQARAWVDVPPADPMVTLARDDYVEIGFYRYF